MRLMLLGSERTGKTSLLQAFKRESLNIQQPPRRVSEFLFGLFETDLYLSRNQQLVGIFRFLIYPIGCMIKHHVHH